METRPLFGLSNLPQAPILCLSGALLASIASGQGSGIHGSTFQGKWNHSEWREGPVLEDQRFVRLVAGPFSLTGESDVIGLQETGVAGEPGNIVIFSAPTIFNTRDLVPIQAFDIDVVADVTPDGRKGVVGLGPDGLQACWITEDGDWNVLDLKTDEWVDGTIVRVGKAGYSNYIAGLQSNGTTMIFWLVTGDITWTLQLPEPVLDFVLFDPSGDGVQDRLAVLHPDRVALYDVTNGNELLTKAGGGPGPGIDLIDRFQPTNQAGDSIVYITQVDGTLTLQQLYILRLSGATEGPFPLNSRVTGAELGDLDGDGDADLVTTSADVQGMYVYLNGEGADAPTFRPDDPGHVVLYELNDLYGDPIPGAPAIQNCDPAIADLDNDGDLDSSLPSVGLGCDFVWKNQATCEDLQRFLPSPLGDGIRLFLEEEELCLERFEGELPPEASMIVAYVKQFTSFSEHWNLEGTWVRQEFPLGDEICISLPGVVDNEAAGVIVRFEGDDYRGPSACYLAAPGLEGEEQLETAYPHATIRTLLRFESKSSVHKRPEEGSGIKPPPGGDDDLPDDDGGGDPLPE